MISFRSHSQKKKATLTKDKISDDDKKILLLSERYQKSVIEEEAIERSVADLQKEKKFLEIQLANLKKDIWSKKTEIDKKQEATMK